MEIAGPLGPARIIPIDRTGKKKRPAGRKSLHPVKEKKEIPLFYNEPIFRAKKHDFF